MRENPSYLPSHIVLVNSKKRLAETLRHVWRTSEFSVHAEREYTDFIFRLPCSLPLEILRQNYAAYHRIFAREGERDWEAILRQGYKKGTYEGKALDKLAERLLREIVVEALRRLLERHKSYFDQTDEQVAQEKKSIRQGIVRTGPRIDVRKLEVLERKLAKRYRKLFAEMKKIKKLVTEVKRKVSDAELMLLISREFPYPWISFLGCAFKNRLPIPGHESASGVFSSGEWTARQIAVGIIVCEESRKKAGLHLTPETIYEKYIRRGNKILEDEEF